MYYITIERRAVIIDLLKTWYSKNQRGKKNEHALFVAHSECKIIVSYLPREFLFYYSLLNILVYIVLLLCAHNIPTVMRTKEKKGKENRQIFSYWSKICISNVYCPMFIRLHRFGGVEGNQTFFSWYSHVM
jgi:hypothetical protein